MSLNLLSNLSLQKTAQNIFNYSTYLLFFIWIPFIFYFKKLLKKNFLRKKINKFNLFSNKYFLLLFLSIFAVTPYILLNKSSNIYYLADYYQRHAFLLAPIFGIFFAILFNDMQNNNPYKKKIYLNFYLMLFLLINLIFLNYGTIRKVEAYHFKKNLITEFKNYGIIPKGDVQIISKNYPADIRSYEISDILLKAYSKTAWWGFIASKPDQRKPLKVQGISILNNKKYMKLNIIENYVFECKSNVYLKNDLSKFNRFKKIYAINYKNYFVIDKIISNCK